MKWQERITIDPQVLVGKPIIKGTRISVEFVIDLLGRGWTQEQILKEYDHLTREDVQACLAYAGDALKSDSVQPSPKPVASGHRSRELEWCRTHAEVLRQFAGQWVVLEGEEIVAHGNDPLQVVADARAKGIRVPYIFYVEETGDNVVKMGL